MYSHPGIFESTLAIAFVETMAIENIPTLKLLQLKRKITAPFGKIYFAVFTKTDNFSLKQIGIRNIFA
jgi:hypothetical protein